MGQTLSEPVVDKVRHPVAMLHCVLPDLAPPRRPLPPPLVRVTPPPLPLGDVWPCVPVEPARIVSAVALFPTLPGYPVLCMCVCALLTKLQNLAIDVGKGRR